MALNIANCPKCGKIFAKGIHNMCPACVKHIEEEYETCLKYLRDNRGATIADLSESTKVSIRQITKFIREGRISLMDAPNLTYPCEMCGILIREGHICDSCRKRLAKDVDTAKEEERRKLEQERTRGKYIYKQE